MRAGQQLTIGIMLLLAAWATVGSAQDPTPPPRPRSAMKGMNGSDRFVWKRSRTACSSHTPAELFCPSVSGYLQAVLPYPYDDRFPRSHERAPWIERMRPFVPCIAAELRHADRCRRLVAVRLLGEIGDQAAVAPLLALLADGESTKPEVTPPPGQITTERVETETISVLSHQLKAPQVAPYMARRIPVSEQVIAAAGYGVVSVGILDALLKVYGSESLPVLEAGMLRALAYQSRANPADPRLLEILWRIIERPQECGNAISLARVICTPEHFPRLATVYLDLYRDECQLRRRLYDLLGTLAGDRWQAFLEQLVIHTADGRCRTRYADDLLSLTCGSSESQDLQLVVACVRGLGQALAGASAKGIESVVLGAMAGVPPQERADAWTVLAGMAPDNLELQLLATRQLHRVHQADETGRLDLAIAAAVRHQELGGRALGEQQDQGVARLQWLLDNREILARSALELVTVEGTPEGTRRATVRIVTEPAAVTTLCSSRPPFAFADHFLNQAFLTTVAAEVRITGHDRDGIDLVLEWTDSPLPELPDTLRLRLLFMAGENQGFRGALESAFVPLP